jgi:hypothetical protein
MDHPGKDEMTDDPVLYALPDDIGQKLLDGQRRRATHDLAERRRPTDRSLAVRQTASHTRWGFVWPQKRRSSDMSDEEFATMSQPALADADDGGLSVEVQIEVLDQVVQAMRDAFT